MDTYIISDRLRLLRTDGSLRVVEPEGCTVIELPLPSFIRACYKSWHNPVSNNHYHRMRQRSLRVYDRPRIESIRRGERDVLVAGSIEGRKGSVDFEMRFADRDGLCVRATLLGREANRIVIGFASSPAERFYGFGEQFSHVDLTGMAFPLISGEQGIGRGAQPCTSIVELKSGAGGDAFTTYAPMPVAVTSAHRAMAFEDDCIVYADIKKTDPSLASFELWSASANLRVWTAVSILEAVGKHTGFTGRYRPLPRWAHGVIAGLRGGRRQVEEVLSRCEESRVPVSAIWIEDWVGRRGANYGPPLWWRWQPDDQVYPDFKGWVRELGGRGIRVLVYFNSFIADDPDYSGRREALERGYCVRNAAGAPLLRKTGSGFGYYTVDLLNPEAFAWLKEIIKTKVVEYGLSGWMADYGEYLGLESVVHGDHRGETVHQRYATEWLRLNREAAEETGLAGDSLIFNRCGSAAANRYSFCFWEGDQNVTWDEHDGLASSVTGLLSGGFSGIAINHADIGGHTTIVNPALRLVRSKELFWRWCELAAFTPVFRTHDGTLTQPNHQFYSSRDTLDFFGLMGRLHARLADYFLHLEAEAEEKGYPVIRHTLLHDESAVGLDLRHQLMVGPDLVLFPVHEAGAASVEGYVPAGRWLDPWRGIDVEGGRFASFPALLGKPACLLRKDGRWGGILYDALRDFEQKETSAYLALAGLNPSELDGGPR